MRGFTLRWCVATLLALFLAGRGLPQSPPQLAAGDAALKDGCKIGPDGTAYVTRVVPVPTTISPEAQKTLARPESDAPNPRTLEERRSGTD